MSELAATGNSTDERNSILGNQGNCPPIGIATGDFKTPNGTDGPVAIRLGTLAVIGRVPLGETGPFFRKILFREDR